MYPALANSETAKRIEREWLAARDAGRSNVETSDEEDEVDIAQLRAMRAEADQPVGELRVLTTEEKIEVVRQANGRSLSVAASRLGKRKEM